MQSIITVSQVNKSYTEGWGGASPHKPVMRPHKTHVLKDIDFTIKQNEFFVILGPSGSGKSTLLRIMTGLERSDTGAVTYHEGISQADIGFVFQQFALLPWLTVSKNIELGLIGRQVPERMRKDVVAAQLKEFRLERFAASYPRQLSGGMKQRVGLARAFATDSKIIFLDEPFSELDLFTSEELRGELLRMWRGGIVGQSNVSAIHSSVASIQENKITTGKTIVMISHNITEAIELADRIAVLSSRPGEIKAIIENRLPRPRAQRTPEFYAMEDKLYAMLKQ
jgi:NitT/TauT family transport system ATP-binding protein